MVPKPLFNVAPGAVAKVSIIDSTLRLSKLPVEYFMTPPVDGFDQMNDAPTWSFLIQSPAGQKILFDLGVPKDITTYTPSIQEVIKHQGWDVQVEKNVADILNENGVSAGEIQSVVWSHFHFDHIGDLSTFPNSTDLVVGPGFKEKFGRGYPTISDSPVHESYWKDRTLNEISFDESDSRVSKVGQFSAFDFFGDGSFYLLDTPGHATGHLGGLARTTSNPDTFIFMGGDLCHHGGEMRPTPANPIPDHVQFPLPDVLRARLSGCPGGDAFRQLNVKRGRREDEPFFDIKLVEDMEKATETIRNSQEADVQDDVYFVFAHDPSARGVVDFFPSSANDWKSKGWREKTHWAFLKDLTAAVASA